MRIDSHQHFWAYDEKQYPWIPRKSPLDRDWLPMDLEPLLAGTGQDASIAVQARQTLEESHWLLTLADHFSTIAGVVGWVDLRSPMVEAQLTELARHKKFVGVRHVVQDEADPDFMLQADFQRGMAKLAPVKLTYDILIHQQQLPAAIKLVARFPEQPFILDHIAKPRIKDRVISPWNEQIRELAKSPNVFCKVSGLVTEAEHRGWKAEVFKPYLDTVVEAFGAQRLMFGSDWPVCLLAASYEQAHQLVQDYARAFSATDRGAIFGGNAQRIYLSDAG